MTRRMQDPWTKEMDAALLTMRRGGMTFYAIGLQVCKSEHACSKRFRTLTGANVGETKARIYSPEPLGAFQERPDDSAYVAKCLAGGGFRGLKFKPGPVFAYRQGQPVRIA